MSSKAKKCEIQVGFEQNPRGGGPRLGFALPKLGETSGMGSGGGQRPPRRPGAGCSGEDFGGFGPVRSRFRISFHMDSDAGDWPNL